MLEMEAVRCEVRQVANVPGANTVPLGAVPGKVLALLYGHPPALGRPQEDLQ